MSERGYPELKKTVIGPDLCTRCGTCVASCPVGVLTYGQNSIELTGECINCGICLKVCPGEGMDLSKHEKILFGRSRKTVHGHRYGVHDQRVQLTSKRKEILRVGYYGGRITSVLVAALESGLIDAALLTDWNGHGHLSIGDGKIARTKWEIMSLASSKYVFSPVLTRLKKIAEDPTISSAAIVGLPCTIQGFRKMELLPQTRQLTRKVKYVIGLNCGSPQTDEETWKKRINKLVGTDPEQIMSFSYRKVSSIRIRLEVVKRDGGTDVKEMKMSRFLPQMGLGKKWIRCSMCPDYSAELSDITFGAPVIRTERGHELLNNALGNGYMKSASFKRRFSQDITDLFVFNRKRFRTWRNTAKRKKKGLPFPKYR